MKNGEISIARFLHFLFVLLYMLLRVVRGLVPELFSLLVGKSAVGQDVPSGAGGYEYK